MGELDWRGENLLKNQYAPVFSGKFFVVFVAFVFIALGVAVYGYFRIPWADHLDTLRVDECVRNSGSIILCSFRRHGAHWHQLFFLVDWLSLKHFNWSTLPTSMLSWLFFLTASLVTLRGLEFRNVPGLGLFVIAYSVFNLNQSINWFWPNQLSVFACLFFAVLCLWVYTKKLVNNSFGKVSMILCALLALLSVLNFAWGLTLLPIMIVGLLFSRIDHRWPHAGLYVGLMVVLLVVFRITSSPGVVSDLSGWSPIVFFALIGNLPSNFSFDLAVVAGSFAIAFYFWGVFVNRTALYENRHTAFAVCVATFALSALLLTSLGRADLGRELARSSRYMSLVGLFWASLLWIYVHRRGSNKKLFVKAGLPILFSLMLLSGMRQLDGQLEYSRYIKDYAKILNSGHLPESHFFGEAYPPDTAFSMYAYKRYLEARGGL